MGEQVSPPLKLCLALVVHPDDLPVYNCIIGEHVTMSRREFYNVKRQNCQTYLENLTLLAPCRRCSTMDVLSGVASTSQLLAYTHSTFQILIRLYKQVKEGPTAIRQQQTCVRVLLTAVDSLNKQPVPEYVLATLLKLSTLAIEALHLIAKSQEKGFLGLHWAAVRNDPALSQVFASLRECRENLLLAISIDTWQVTKDSSKIMGLLNPKVSISSLWAIVIQLSSCVEGM